MKTIYEWWFKNSKADFPYQAPELPEDGAFVAKRKVVLNSKNKLVEQDHHIPDDRWIWCDTEDEFFALKYK